MTGLTLTRRPGGFDIAFAGSATLDIAPESKIRPRRVEVALGRKFEESWSGNGPMIRRVSNAAIVQSLLDQTFLYQTDHDRFIDRGFIDYDVQPYPAVSPQKLFAFHRLLGQSFSVAHRSVETEDGHVVTRVVLKPKPKPTKTDNPAKPGEPQNSSTPAAPDAWPCLRAIWFWNLRKG